MLGVTLSFTSLPLENHKNRDKLRFDGPLGLYAERFGKICMFLTSLLLVCSALQI